MEIKQREKILSPDQHSFEAAITSAPQGLNHEKLSCKICQRNIDNVFMSQITKNILKGETLGSIMVGLFILLVEY